MKQRILFIDLIRALAIILMVFFHLAYDLTAFKYLGISFQKDLFWWVLPRFIVFLFLLAVGMSLKMAHPEQVRWKPFWIRFGKIAIGASFVSLSTWYMFPDHWVYFGTLHCIALASLFGLPLRKMPRLSLAMGIMILLPLCFGIKLPWWEMDHKSMDYIPLLPWFGVVLIGVFLTSTPLMTWTGDQKLQEKCRPFVFLSKHSLVIYLLHQPILFGSIWVITRFLR